MTDNPYKPRIPKKNDKPKPDQLDQVPRRRVYPYRWPSERDGEATVSRGPYDRIRSPYLD
jgi:hypothetical protein